MTHEALILLRRSRLRWTLLQAAALTAASVLVNWMHYR